MYAWGRAVPTLWWRVGFYYVRHWMSALHAALRGRVGPAAGVAAVLAIAALAIGAWLVYGGGRGAHPKGPREGANLHDAGMTLGTQAVLVAATTTSSHPVTVSLPGDAGDSGTGVVSVAAWLDAASAPSLPASAGAPAVPPGVAAGEALPSYLASDVAASETQMVFACFAFYGDTLVLETQTVVAGSMRLPPTAAPGPGLYHRVLSATGRVLAQGRDRDPRLVYYDYPREDGSGMLAGGVVRMSNAQFVVRYPLIAGMDTIEMYAVEVASDRAAQGGYKVTPHGTFKLAARLP